MNIEGLKLGFFQYLQEKYANENNEIGAENLDLATFNVFMYQSEFQEYIEEQGADVTTFNLSEDNGDFTDISADDINAVMSMLNDLEANGEFTEDSLPVISEQNSSILPKQETNVSTRNKDFSFLKDLGVEFNDDEKNTLNILFGEDEENAKQLLSYIDGNVGQLTKNDLQTLKQYINKLKGLGFSDEEIKKNIMGLDGKSDKLTGEDFAKLKKELEGGSLLQSLEEASEAGIQTNSEMEASGNGDAPSGTPSASANTEKNIDNMSISELEAELENAKAEQQKAKDEYMTELETVNSELAGKIKDTTAQKTQKETELQSKQQELTDYNSQKTQAISELNAAKAQISSIDGQISTLKSQLNQEGADTAAINSQIATLEEQKRQLEQETIPNLEDKISQLDEKITELETNTIPTLEKEISDLDKSITTLEAEAMQLASSNAGLQAKLDVYNKAGDYINSVESKLQTRKLNKEKYENMDMPDKTMAPKDFRDDPDNYDNLPLTYTLDGKEYKCVGFSEYDLDGDGKTDFKPDSWEEVQRYFANAGVANIGKYGTMQCHNYSDILGQFILGDANMDFVRALYDETNDPNFNQNDLAGKMATDRAYNERTFAKADSGDRDDSHAIIKNELQNGRPSVINVNGHYVLAVGIADDGEILIWDSYNGSMQRLGRSSNNSEKAHRNMVNGDAVMVYADNYYYHYGRSCAFDYWQYVENDPEYVRKNAYK